MKSTVTSIFVEKTAAVPRLKGLLRMADVVEFFGPHTGKVGT
jgi:hypothetical protein